MGSPFLRVSQGVTGRPAILDFVDCGLGVSRGQRRLMKKIPTEADRGPSQLILRAFVGLLPPKAARSTIHLEEVVEFSAVVYGSIRQRQNEQRCQEGETNDSGVLLDQMCRTW